MFSFGLYFYFTLQVWLKLFKIALLQLKAG